MPLTDAEARAAQPGEKIRRISDGGGLHLEVNTQGRKYWIWRHRFPPARNGKQQDYRVGPYPKISLKKAREIKEQQKRRLYEEGINPCAAKKEDRIQRYRPSQAPTFQAVAEDWHKNKSLGQWSERHSSDVRQKLVVDIFPRIGSRLMGQVTTPACLEVLRAIEKRGSLEQAKRTLGVVSQVCDYACALGYLSFNPATALKREAPVKHINTHFPCIRWEELPELVEAVDSNKSGSEPLVRKGLQLLALTFPRPNELTAADWTEINWDKKIWTVPAARMKGSRGSRREHLVPLSERSTELFRDIYEVTGPAGFIFKSIRTKSGYISNNTLNMALKRMGFDKRMCPHGFRAFAMTNIQEQLRIDLRIIDRQLAHVERNKVAAAYNRSEYWDERVDMMNRWAELLEENGW